MKSSKDAHTQVLSYKQFKYIVIVDGDLPDWFSVETGVRQESDRKVSSLILYYLFGCLIDWIMRRTMADRPRTLRWTLISKLEDLDFADDTVALCRTRCHQEEKVNRLSRCSMQVDLTINTSNTQGICINAIPDASITADVKRVGLVEEFGDLGSPVARDNAAPVEVHLLDSSLYGS